MLTAAQQDARRHGLGGSDAAAALGLSPYRTPLDVYMEKVGEQEPPDLRDRNAVLWGNLLEDAVAREYARRTGVKVRRRNRTVHHPDLPWLLGNIDREIVGERKLLEVKTTGYWPGRSLGKDGTDEVPDAWLVQVHHYLLATGYRAADIAALIGGQELRIYPVAFDQELADMLVERERWFWEECVEKRMPPPPTTVEDLALLFREDSGGTVETNPSVSQAVADLKAVKHQQKELDARAKDAEFLIKEHLGEAATLVDADGHTLATWKTQTATRLDQTRLRTEEPDTFARFSSESTYRVLRLK
ncbi:MAG: YqaJ viral recombinase family protein [Chromatiaceae bacterium]|jgi:putative phage-type endonuclease|nr:YqaJ viral recombinase family protein [Chromatiaceae bacterium]